MPAILLGPNFVDKHACTCFFTSAFPLLSYQITCYMSGFAYFRFISKIAAKVGFPLEPGHTQYIWGTGKGPGHMTVRVFVSTDRTRSFDSQNNTCDLGCTDTRYILDTVVVDKRPWSHMMMRHVSTFDHNQTGLFRMPTSPTHLQPRYCSCWDNIMSSVAIGSSMQHKM